MSDATIAFSQVSVTLQNQSLVRQLSFTVAQGETLVLLGRSGSGKTTTLKLINRLLDPTEGTVKVAGIATTDWNAIQLRRQIGYVIQEVGLFPHLTIERNVGVVPRLEGWKPTRIQERVEQLLTLVGLNPAQFADRYPHQLSGGQRQRVGVARALAADPPILLMDEPFGALDPITRRELQQEFRQLQQQLNKTVVLVTHDVQEALILGSSIGLIEHGQLISLGTSSQLLRSSHPVVQAFVQCLPDRDLWPHEQDSVRP
jgi:osmoprotectant transport system ATP-binding protein